MKSSVKKGSVDVEVKGKGAGVKNPVLKKGLNHPDADSVASKYGVGDDESLGDDGNGNANGTGGLTLEQQVELARAQQAMVQKLETKNREVERLCTLLEAVEPMPGMNPETYRRIIENPDAGAVDFRDSKIVDLAKKCRSLQMALSRERGGSETLAAKLEQLEQVNDKLESELHRSAAAATHHHTESRTISAGSSAFLSSSYSGEGKQHQNSNKGNGNSSEKTAQQLQQELGRAHKKTEELRRKLQEAEEENKKLGRVLLKEVGDSSLTLEEAVDEGRKGRAQTIIMLKNKVKRLEQQQQQQSQLLLGTDSDGGSAREGGGSTASMTVQQQHSRGANVDAQAEEELEYMSSARKMAVDQLAEAHAALEEKHRTLTDRHNGTKARVRTLEAEAGQHKQQMRIVIDKSETDDRLVHALKSEIARLKASGVGNKQNAATQQASDQVEARVQRAAKEAAAAATSSVESELTRLRRLTKQQAEQLATQEALIKEFRASNTGGSGSSSRY